MVGKENFDKSSKIFPLLKIFDMWKSKVWLVVKDTYDAINVV